MCHFPCLASFPLTVESFALAANFRIKWKFSSDSWEFSCKSHFPGLVRVFLWKSISKLTQSFPQSLSEFSESFPHLCNFFVVYSTAATDPRCPVLQPLLYVARHTVLVFSWYPSDIETGNKVIKPSYAGIQNDHHEYLVTTASIWKSQILAISFLNK